MSPRMQVRQYQINQQMAASSSARVLNNRCAGGHIAVATEVCASLRAGTVHLSCDLIITYEQLFMRMRVVAGEGVESPGRVRDARV